MDVGWNVFGEAFKTMKTEKDACLDEICNFIKENATVLHLDLSNNHFTYKQSERIQTALKKNHSIFGFHFTGNKGYVDSENYLILDSNENQSPEFFSSHILKEINGVCKQNFNSLSQYECIQQIKNPCWICDGWLELEFEWTDINRITDAEYLDGDDVPRDLSPVFIHFKHENYKANWMKQDDDGRIVMKIMVPNTRLFFFFTINNVASVSKDYMSVCLDTPEHVV